MLLACFGARMGASLEPTGTSDAAQGVFCLCKVRLIVLLDSLAYTLLKYLTGFCGVFAETPEKNAGGKNKSHSFMKNVQGVLQGVLPSMQTRRGRTPKRPHHTSKKQGVLATVRRRCGENTQEPVASWSVLSPVVSARLAASAIKSLT